MKPYEQIVGFRRFDGVRCECSHAYVAATARLDPSCPLHREPTTEEYNALDVSGLDVEAMAERIRRLVEAAR